VRVAEALAPPLVSQMRERERPAAAAKAGR